MLTKLEKTVRQELTNRRREKKKILPHPNDGEGLRVLREVAKKGYSVLSNHRTPEECAIFRSEIDRLCEVYREEIWRGPLDSDHRIFGSNHLSDPISSMWEDPFLRRIIENYERSTKIVGFTLAARLEYRPGNPGSGDGWHRDRADAKQTKAMLYVSDTSAESGPFQYIEGSHRPVKIINEMVRSGFEHNQNRFTNEEIDRIIARDPGLLKTFTAKAGTVILFDSRGIHRGSPISKGNRYALTNYCWFDMEIPEHIGKLIPKRKAHPKTESEALI